MTPTPKSTSTSPGSSAPRPMPRSTGKKTNIWLIVSIILAIALVGVLAFYKISQDQSDLVVIPADEAGDKLLSFINDIYGPQVGVATLKGVAEKNGLYEITVTVTDQQGQPVEQVIFITLDGEFFIPQALDIEDLRSQFQAWQQQLDAQQQQLPLNPIAPDALEPPAEEPVEE